MNRVNRVNRQFHHTRRCTSIVLVTSVGKLTGITILLRFKRRFGRPRISALDSSKLGKLANAFVSSRLGSLLPMAPPKHLDQKNQNPSLHIRQDQVTADSPFECF